MAKELKLNLPSADSLFSTQEERDDAKLERVMELPLSEISDFLELIAIYLDEMVCERGNNTEKIPLSFDDLSSLEQAKQIRWRIRSRSSHQICSRPLLYQSIYLVSIGAWLWRRFRRFPLVFWCIH
jgi:hypothetical protein